MKKIKKNDQSSKRFSIRKTVVGDLSKKIAWTKQFKSERNMEFIYKECGSSVASISKVTSFGARIKDH